MAREVGDAFVQNPCMEFGDLLMVLNKVPDPPGYEQLPNTAKFYQNVGDMEVFSCPLLPMGIRKKPVDVATDLGDHSHTLLNGTFGGGGVGSG